jgi:hypothetical protein
MIAALLVSAIGHRGAVIDRIHFSILELRIISVLSLAFGVSIAIEVLSLSAAPENGSVLSAFQQFVPALLAISVMTATYTRIADTNGGSVMSWYIAFVLVGGIVPGLLMASKEGMLTPLLCWLVVVASSRHRFTWLGALGMGLVAVVAWGFVYPFSLNARFPVREALTLSDKVDLILEYIRDPTQFPDNLSDPDESSEFGTSSSKVNIVARYSLLRDSDDLIHGDLTSGFTSIDRYFPVLFSIVPHVLWPDRPVTITSNELGHKAGIVTNPDDSRTGIAIGTPAYFFDVGGWSALIVYSLFLFALFFVSTVRLVGTAETGIWGLVLTGNEANIAGNCSPSVLITMFLTFIGIFFILIAILKLFSYFAKSLISRSVTN